MKWAVEPEGVMFAYEATDRDEEGLVRQITAAHNGAGCRASVAGRAAELQTRLAQYQAAEFKAVLGC